MNAEERTQILEFLGDFEDLFDGVLGEWDPYLINLELNPGSKQFNSKCYPVPRMNKNTFHNDIKRSVKMGVLALVQ